MAVTKIRKISSWTLLLSSVISLIVLGIFYGGGITNPGAEMEEPVYTGLLLNWTSALFFITVASTVIFALWQFITLLKTSPKSALMAFIAIICFAAVLFITYAIGDATPLKGLNSDSEVFNTPFWLKVTDMWINSCAILMILIVVAVVSGSVKNMLNR